MKARRSSCQAQLRQLVTQVQTDVLATRVDIAEIRSLLKHVADELSELRRRRVGLRDRHDLALAKAIIATVGAISGFTTSQLYEESSLQPAFRRAGIDNPADLGRLLARLVDQPIDGVAFERRRRGPSGVRWATRPVGQDNPCRSAD